MTSTEAQQCADDNDNTNIIVGQRTPLPRLPRTLLFSVDDHFGVDLLPLAPAHRVDVLARKVLPLLLVHLLPPLLSLLLRRRCEVRIDFEDAPRLRVKHELRVGCASRCLFSQLARETEALGGLRGAARMPRTRGGQREREREREREGEREWANERERARE